MDGLSDESVSSDFDERSMSDVDYDDDHVEEDDDNQLDNDDEYMLDESSVEGYSYDEDEDKFNESFEGDFKFQLGATLRIKNIDNGRAKSYGKTLHRSNSFLDTLTIIGSQNLTLGDHLEQLLSSISSNRTIRRFTLTNIEDCNVVNPFLKAISQSSSIEYVSLRNVCVSVDSWIDFLIHTESVKSLSLNAVKIDEENVNYIVDQILSKKYEHHQNFTIVDLKVIDPTEKLESLQVLKIFRNVAKSITKFSIGTSNMTITGYSNNFVQRSDHSVKTYANEIQLFLAQTLSIQRMTVYSMCSNIAWDELLFDGIKSCINLQEIEFRKWHFPFHCTSESFKSIFSSPKSKIKKLIFSERTNIYPSLISEIIIEKPKLSLLQEISLCDLMNEDDDDVSDIVDPLIHDSSLMSLDLGLLDDHSIQRIIPKLPLLSGLKKLVIRFSEYRTDNTLLLNALKRNMCLENVTLNGNEYGYNEKSQQLCTRNRFRVQHLHGDNEKIQQYCERNKFIQHWLTKPSTNIVCQHILASAREYEYSNEVIFAIIMKLEIF